MKVWRWAGIFKTFPIALYTYILQNNVMNIYHVSFNFLITVTMIYYNLELTFFDILCKKINKQDLKDKSPKKMGKCLKIATYFTTVCYLIVGFFGYMQLSD